MGPSVVLSCEAEKERADEFIQLGIITCRGYKFDIANLFALCARQYATDEATKHKDGHIEKLKKRCTTQQHRTTEDKHEV